MKTHAWSLIDRDALELLSGDEPRSPGEEAAPRDHALWVQCPALLPPVQPGCRNGQDEQAEQEQGPCPCKDGHEKNQEAGAKEANPQGSQEGAEVGDEGQECRWQVAATE